MARDERPQPVSGRQVACRDPEHDTDYWQNEEDSRTRGEKKRWMVVGRVEYKKIVIHKGIETGKSIAPPMTPANTGTGDVDSSFMGMRLTPSS